MPTIPTIDVSKLRMPWRVDRWHLPLPDRFPPGRLLREIAFFGYAQGPYDGDTENQEDIFVVSPLTGSVRRVVDDRGAAYKSDRDPAWSPSRRTLALHYATTADPASRLRLVSAATGAVTRELVEGHSPEWLDHSTLLFLRAGASGGGAAVGIEVYAVDIPTLATRRITDLGPDVDVTGIAWHRTAGLAVSYATYGPTPSWDLAVLPVAAVAAARAPGGTPIGPGALHPLTPGRHVAGPDWSRTAHRIALTTWEAGSPSRVGYLDVATGRVRLVPGPRPTPGSPALTDAGAVFSPDGGMIAFTRGHEDGWSEIWLYNLVTHRLRRLTNDHEHRFKGGLDW